MLKTAALILSFIICGNGMAQDSPAMASAPPQWVDLTDDLSRGDLASYEVINFGPPADKDVRRAFMFPKDTNDGIYGIDVSHHNGVVDWAIVAQRGVRFAYIKASQGDRFRDSRFAANWAAAGKNTTIRRGAYHFLTPDRSGKDQAKIFLAILDAAGGLKKDDLTPVLDLEWAFAKQNGKDVDQWEMLDQQKIAQIVIDCATAIKTATGRTPVIYTAASWWNGRMKDSTALIAYPHWTADYRAASIKAGAPQSVRRHVQLAWQFTDTGLLQGGAKKFDVNRLNGSDLNKLSGL